MGAPIQATMFFKQGNSGWSEVLVMAPDKFASLKEANDEVTKQGGLGQRRVQLLGAGAELIGIRLSKFGVWRDSNYTAKAAGFPNGGIWNTPSYSASMPAANPWDALTIRLECGDSYRRLVYLGGVPQEIFSAPLGGPYQVTWSNNLNSYFDYLAGKGNFTAGKYGTMVKSKNVDDSPAPNINTAPGAAPTLTVANGQGQVTLGCTQVAFKVVAGQQVRILGVRGQPGIDLRKWNGIFTVLNGNVAQQFTIIPKVTPDQATFAALDWSAAYVFLPQQQFQPFTDWDFEAYTHRKRGVAFGTPRGRVRTRE